MIKATVLADSICRTRVTTFEVTFPRFLLAQVNTYKQISKNGSSSRAIPISRRIQEVLDNPYLPMELCANQSGMVAGEALSEEDQAAAAKVYLELRDAAVEATKKLGRLGVHKEWANRLLEPWAWQKAILTSTHWSNLYGQRIHKDAQPEFETLARAMKEAQEASTPELLRAGQWHVPMLRPEEKGEFRAREQEYEDHADGAIINGKAVEWDPTGKMAYWLNVSAARCARVSYDTHDGVRDLDKDEGLAADLVHKGHMSPFEHQAQAVNPQNTQPPWWPETPSAPLWDYEDGNLRGWKQYRKMFAHEGDYTALLASRGDQ